MVAAPADVVILVKPQFEVRRRSWQRSRPPCPATLSGVVRGVHDRAGVAGVRGGVISPLRGPEGIANFLLHLQGAHTLSAEQAHVVYAPECASGYFCITRPVMRSPYGWDKTDGKTLARQIEQELALRVKTLQETTPGKVPTLATILVGNDPASATYVKMKGTPVTVSACILSKSPANNDHDARAAR